MGSLSSRFLLSIHRPLLVISVRRLLCLRLLRFHSPGLGGLGSSIDHDMGASLFGDSDVPFVVAVEIELDVANVSGASRGESSAELKDSVAYPEM